MIEEKTLTLGSLFDGIGGFPYAASFYGIRALWASEILPDAVSITMRHFPEMKHLGDILSLRGGEIPPVDIITFGSPCQGLSMAGKRQGLADERSGLFSEAIRIIREMQEVTNHQYPKYAVWENVPGALSSNRGYDFKAVLEAFTKTEIPFPSSGRWTNAGMVRGNGVDLAWCVYDAQHFRTAQRRRRVFLIADLTGKCAGQILFVPKSLRRYFEAGGTPRQAASLHAAKCAGATDAGIDGYNGAITGEKAATLGVNCGMSTGRNGVLQSTDIEILNDQGGNNLSIEKGGVSPTLRSETHGNLPIVVKTDEDKAAAFMAGQSPSAGGIAYSEKVSPTLKSGSSGTNQTPCVCERHTAEIGINGNLAGTLHATYYKGTGARGNKERDVVLCAATGQSHAEIFENLSPTLNCACEQPYITHPKIAGTLCASGAGLSRPAGMASETELCIVPAKTYKVRRLTPVECERLQGFPDDWTKFADDGRQISDSKRYQMLGNSIAVPCVAYIMQGICDAEKERR